MWTAKCRLKFRYNKKKTFKQFYYSTHYYPVYIYIYIPKCHFFFFLICWEIDKFWIQNITTVNGIARNFIQGAKLNITKFSKVKNYDNRITQYKYQ